MSRCLPLMILMVIACGRMGFDQQTATSDANNTRTSTPLECETEDDCVDGNLCTDDACDDGVCSWSANSSLSCDDGDLCTSNDQCSAGVCAAVAYVCDDNNGGTADSCDGDGTCTFKDLAPLRVSPEGGAANTIGGAGQTIWANGTYAFLGLSEGAKGIQIFDVATPSGPVARGVFRTDDGGPASLSTWANDVLGIDVVGSTAYLATYFGGLVLLDISDVDAPRFLSALALSGETWSVKVRGTHAFVSSKSQGLLVVDVSDPFAPTQVASLSLGATNDIHLDGDRLYAASSGRFDIVDVSNPTNPISVGFIDTGTMLYGVWAPPGGPAYVIDNISMELLTIDVSGSTPILLDTTAPGPHLYRSITGVPGNLFVGLGTNAVAGEVRSYSLATPEQPVLTDQGAASDAIYEVMAVGDMIYAATFDGRVQVFRAAP